jgi:hypothetical protein
MYGNSPEKVWHNVLWAFGGELRAQPAVLLCNLL